MSGFMHSIKKLIAHTAKTPDPQYDAVYENFNKLHNTIYRVKQNLHSYTQAMQQLFNSSNAITIDLGSLIEEKTDGNTTPGNNNKQARYNELVAEMRDKHHELIGEKSHLLSTQAANEVLKKLDEEIDTYKGIQSRINMREELHGELDYYTKKVEKLQQEKDKRALSDSGDSAKHTEKLLRNQQKLADQQTKFAPYNQELIKDMEKVWSNRKLILGPALNCFAKLEKDLGQSYYHVIKEIRLVGDMEIEQDLKEQNEQKQTIIRNNSFHAEQQQHKQHVSSTSSTANTTAANTANTSREPSPVRQQANNQPHFVQNTEPGKFNSQIANNTAGEQHIMITPTAAPTAPTGNIPYVDNTTTHMNPLSVGLPNKTDSVPNPFAHTANSSAANTTTTTTVAELASEADKNVAYLNQQTTSKPDNNSMPAGQINNTAEGQQEIAARNSAVFNNTNNPSNPNVLVG